MKIPGIGGQRPVASAYVDRLLLDGHEIGVLMAVLPRFEQRT
jgi:hypothetical protein